MVHLLVVIVALSPTLLPQGKAEEMAVRARDAELVHAQIRSLAGSVVAKGELDALRREVVPHCVSKPLVLLLLLSLTLSLCHVRISNITMP
jgi:hypothetical protein